jgi:SWIM zinc finger
MAETIDRSRLARAVWLDAHRVGPPGEYRVSGGQTLHQVRLYADDGELCDCSDFLFHRQPCKHVLAAQLREGEEKAIRALRFLVPPPKRR